ncbi:MAG: AtpZ/AtpI family protein [Anaerolineales bacterium]|nr:AtpZ/AtpI family protein [Anaerolineales bacterium]
MTDPKQRSSHPLLPILNQMGNLAAQIAGVSLLLIFGAVFGGQWLDKLFGTGHAILIALVIAIGPLSLLLTFRLAMRAVRNLPPPTVASTNIQSDEKED